MISFISLYRRAASCDLQVELEHTLVAPSTGHFCNERTFIRIREMKCVQFGQLSRYVKIGLQFYEVPTLNGCASHRVTKIVRNIYTILGAFSCDLQVYEVRWS